MNNSLVSLAVVTLVANLIAFGSGVVQAAHVMCGDIIVANTKLDESLTCDTDGLTIGADGVTLDLNGFTIAGGSNIGEGVFNFGFNNVVIKNGAISGFRDGIQVDGVTGITLKDLAISSQQIGISIVITNSAKVKIDKVSISQPPGGGGGIADAIRVDNVDDARVTNVTVDGGVFGLIGFDTRKLSVVGNTFGNPDVGILVINSAGVTVRNNKIVGADIDIPCFGGINLFGTSSGRVEIGKNVVTGCHHGILVGGPEVPRLADIVIRKNNLYANKFSGISITNVENSRIIGNRVHLNGECGTCGGIRLLFGSTGNTFERNKVTGNDEIDLFHDPGSSPNKWIRNTCDTSSGADIDCPPSVVADYVNDFSSSVGPASLFGDAVLDNGSVRLTDNINDQIGSIVIDELVPGGAIASFAATFDLQTGPGTGTPADGISFNLGPLPNAAFGEEGIFQGLTISFDTFNNGSHDPIGIDVRVNGTVVASDATNPFTNGVFVPVSVVFDADGTLDLTFGGAAIFTDLPTGFTPATFDRFGFGGRTGGANEVNRIDNVSIVVVTQ